MLLTQRNLQRAEDKLRATTTALLSGKWVGDA